MVITTLHITNASVVCLDQVHADYTVICHDGRITWVGPSAEAPTADAECLVDARGQYLVPGFIDLHIHGTGKYLIDNGPDDLAGLSGLLPKYGVTSFLPGVCPLPKGTDSKFLARLAKVVPQGAEFLGFHLEGPFLTLTGALPPEALGSADIQRLGDLIAAAEPYRAVFSIAPDFEGVDELLPIMAAGGTPVFMTHTAATVAQTQAAIEAGARHATHFYDVFPVPPDTDPGVRPAGAVEAILADARVSVDFILDGCHVDPVVAKMALQCKGPDRVCLITDANIGAGLPPGRYSFGSGGAVEFREPGGPARLTAESHMAGGLAGSGLTMDRALRNAISMLHVELPTAVRMVSANPAQVLGLLNRKGQIKPACDADMVLLDNDLKVVQTWIAAKCCYERTA